jgi:hypothetical protein
MSRRPGPGPVADAPAHAGLDRILEDVLQGVPEVLLRLDHPRGEAVAEEVPPPAVAAVVTLSIEAVEPLHSGRKLLPGRLDDEVVVRVHQAPRMEPPREPHRDVAQEENEVLTVVVIPVDPHFRDAERRDVVHAVGEMGSRDSRHACDRR